MASGLDIDFVRQLYAKMPDEELIRTATTNGYGLTPEAFIVVKEEILKRKLDNNILRGLEALNKTYTIEEIDAYASLIQNLPCPKCGSTQEKLNGTLTSEVMSFIIFSQHNRDLKVACPDCLDKATGNSLVKSLLLGWWGIPWGIIRTIQSIGHYFTARKQHHIKTPNDFLRTFVLGKIGEIETNKNDMNKLLEIILTK